MKSVDVKIREYDGEIVTKEFSVNDNGNGLFVWENGSYKQLKGTCDFHAKNPKSLIRKIKALYYPDVVGMKRGSADGWGF